MGDQFQNAHVLDEAVAKSGIDLKNVPVSAHSSVTQQILRICEGEQILASGYRMRVVLADCGIEVVIKGITDLLEPTSPYGSTASA